MTAVGRSLGLWLSLLAGLGSVVIPNAGEANPRSHGAASQKSVRARRLLNEGIAALSIHNFAGATRALADSYRVQPSAEAIFYLGALNLAEGRVLDAQDLMRRFVSDPRLGITPDTPEAQEAQRILAQAGPPHGQLNILGEEGTLVFIDGRLRGSLPLARPLLLAVGERRVTLEHGARIREEQLTITTGRYFELRHSAASDAVIVVQLPSVLLVDSYDGVPADAPPQLARAVADQLRAEHYSPVPKAEAMADVRDPQLFRCVAEVDCQARLGEQAGVDLLLVLQAEKKAADWRLRLQVLDVRVGDVAASSEQRCADCTTQHAATAIGSMVQPLLLQAKSRPQGMIQVDSVPSGAEVRLGTRLLGRTPLVQALWAGPQDLAFSLSGYQSQIRRVPVSPGQTAELRAEMVAALAPTLAPPPVAPPAATHHNAHRSLPRKWSLGGGIAALAAGSLLLGFGVSGLYQAGQCSGALPADSLCPESYHTVVPGATLTAVGSALLLGGALLIAIPELHPQERSHARQTAASVVSADHRL